MTQANWLVLARATSGDPDGSCAEVKAGYVDPPTPEKLAEIKSKMADLYRYGFDEDPVTVVAVVLPWVNEQDADEASS